MGVLEKKIKYVKKFAKDSSKMNAELASSIITGCYNEFRALGTELERQIAELQKNIISMQETNNKCKGSDQLARKYGYKVLESCNKALLAINLIKRIAHKL